jgi:hypothetical protein
MGSDRLWMPAQAADPIIEVIDGYKEYVWLSAIGCVQMRASERSEEK